MAQWGRDDQAVTANSSTTHESTTGQPLYTSGSNAKWGNATGEPNTHFGNTSTGSRAAVDANLWQNDTPSAFITNMSVGVFGVSAAEMANNVTNKVADMPQHAGWVIRRAGTGGIATAAFGTGASGTLFANGETVTVSNGSANAHLTVLTGNLAGVTNGNVCTLSVTSGGAGWANTAMVKYTFDREKHLTSITVGANANTYNNNSLIVVSNGLVNATASMVTDGNGHIATGNVTVATIGLFPNTFAGANVVITIANAGGGAVQGNASVTAFTAVFANSATGNLVVTLGGRAGRVHTETLVAMGSLGAQTAAYGTPAVANTGSTYYPG